ncbi:MAG: DNA polymerase III subunit beta [Candidatus Komeilibacteria bacterium RIFCSPLOWO2_01_FULL_52_15]|uniref:Beta sliding clamp n=2 Tax=Candidatus Komeiliibacteriota TaxID=1817908 RepID=A0A1G2BPL9_9BACT|nr:MAG: DNA polymerase III subunit beta [Candidatus Komeilibacteria bacterium RIFCSPHIGHO2_01_FULL_52_14]OGY91053.1 MAG: DNA polymerase III subunit beta [Candidatus Komeilibacteria bacterium RIFCSPLOWO2_01_FULL_52_15]
MKFTCTQENLSKGLTIAARFSDRNINLPILNNVLLRAKKEGVIFTATNLELAITTVVRGKIETPGEFTVASRLLAEFVNSLKKEIITVSLEEKTLTITGENHQTTLRGIDATDFPVIPTIDSKTAFTIPGDVLRHALSQVLFAAGTDESRPEITGVFLRVENSTCTLASTDSYRLAQKKIAVKQAPKEDREVIIPAKTLAEVVRIAEIEEPKEVSIAINENQIKFTVGDTEITSRIIAGEYPDYKQIIPASFKNEVAFAANDMVRAIKTTSLFCKQGINDIRLSLEKRFTDIAVTAENSTLGKNTSNVPSLSKQQEFDIVFNYKFFLDGLQHLMGEQAVLKTNDPASPALLSSPSEKDFLYIIMPIRQ